MALNKNIKKRLSKKDKEWFQILEKHKDSYSKVIDYLIFKKITPDQALAILDKTLVVNPTSFKAKWKMIRFTLYLWARIEENEKGLLGKKIETIRRVVVKPEYQNMREPFGFKEKFNPEKEIKNLNLLVTDPRQWGYFRTENFVFKGTNKNIPQELIDKVR
jgi:hypothetical protein